MVVGLGTGTTAIFAIRRLAALLESGELRDIAGVATSRASEAEAQRLRSISPSTAPTRWIRR
jgi:ribose 5-phosphate isomerase A